MIFGINACATTPANGTKAPSEETPSIKVPIKSKAVPQKPAKKIWVPGGWNKDGVWVPGHWKTE